MGLHWDLLTSPRHVSHVGWDPQNGFDVSNSKDPLTHLTTHLPFHSPLAQTYPQTPTLFTFLSDTPVG